MRIYFCDVCNESVPQADLEEEKALLTKGRVTCSACQSAMSSELRSPGEASVEELAATAMPTTDFNALDGSPDDTTIMDAGAPALLPQAPPPAATGATIGVALASVALIFTVGMTAFLYGEFNQVSESLVREIEDGRADWNEAARSLENRLTRSMRNAASGVRASDASLDDLALRIDENAALSQSELSGLRAELARIASGIDELERLTAAVGRNETELTRVAVTTAELHDEFLRLTHRLGEFESTRTRLLDNVPRDPVDEEPTWLALTRDLTSQNSGKRWQAVQSLGATHDPGVAEHLIALLNDPDIFVRMATARILGELEATIGIAALIDALADPEASVREAVVVALRSITGRSFRFDPLARESDRAKRVKAWRDWWKKSADDFR